ncbi:hypothetical protein B0T18DRAFT_455812 [Schizothecium vesticola]|uniref:Uncharacterized protein n=1 Tax=Schizothecium vesticola TaxID=314040 RepID=A0AA40K9B8_9PEZI|nr:hypothetical protein B0T18DRAFT_455812 [Schizothecium vesticola]
MTACTSTYGDMSQTKKDWIASLTEVLPLTPIDRTAPVGYFSLVYGFPGGPWPYAKRRRSIAHIAIRLKAVIAKFPFLGGQLLLDDGQPERSKVMYSPDPRAANITQLGKSDIHPIHCIQDEMISFKTDLFDSEVTMAEILRNGAPPSAIKPDFLHPSATATHYKNGHYLHPLTLRTSILKDGLILGFSVHHSAMDLAGFTPILASFADLGTAPPFDLAAHLTTCPPPPLHHPRLLPRTPAHLAPLHTFCLHRTRARLGADAFVSRVDVLSALVWVVLTCARARAWPANADGKPTLSPTAPTRFCTAVNLRERMGIAGVYTGNCFMRVLTAPDVTVERLLGGLEEPRWEQVANAAGWIRAAIEDLDRDWPGHVKLARIAAGLENGGGPEVARRSDVGQAVARATARDGAGVDCSVNVTMGGPDVMFDIPGLAGADAEGKVRPAFVRFPFDRVGGCVRILPRVGGAKGTEDWEVLIPVREEESTFLVTEFERLVSNPFL